MICCMHCTLSASSHAKEVKLSLSTAPGLFPQEDVDVLKDDVLQSVKAERTDHSAGHEHDHKQEHGHEVKHEHSHSDHSHSHGECKEEHEHTGDCKHDHEHSHEGHEHHAHSHKV